MARARIVKPSFFTNDELAACGPCAMLMFEGLWCHADREGRLEDRPARLKIQILPYFDVDANAELQKLADAGFILRYEAEGAKYIQVLNFTKHQRPHSKELESVIPAPTQVGASTNLGGGEHQPGKVPARPLTLNPLPLTLNPSCIDACASTKGRREVEYTAEFNAAWETYPSRIGDNPKKKAFGAWNARLKEGHTADEMTQGASRYRAWVAASGKTNTEFVMQASRFFGPDKPFLKSWQVQCGQPGRKAAPKPRTVEDYRENLKAKLSHEQPDAIDSTATRLD